MRNKVSYIYVRAVTSIYINIYFDGREETTQTNKTFFFFEKTPHLRKCSLSILCFEFCHCCDIIFFNFISCLDLVCIYQKSVFH